MNARLAGLVDAVRTQLWPIPLVAVILALGLGTALPALDTVVDTNLPESVSGLLFSGGPDAARAVLQAIAGSLITVTSLTFSLTVVTLQLASSQFSPRVLRTFVADRFVHITLALFMSGFAFALTVLRSVRSETGTDPGFVPEISVTVAFLLAIASILGLVLFLAHLTREIRAETVMQRVADETLATLNRNFPADDDASRHAPTPSHDAFQVESAATGFLTSVDRGALLRVAIAEQAVLRVNVQPGDSLVTGVPFATIWPLDPNHIIGPESLQRLNDGINNAVFTGSERTNVQDVAFGFRQLVDVAARALSPGVNDPTTAVHVMGHISGLLCRVVELSPGTKCLCDDQDVVRVILSMPDMADLLDLALAQPRLYGMGDFAVAKRLLSVLEEVSWCDRTGLYHAEIRAQAQKMGMAVETGSHLPEERTALMALVHGLSVNEQHRRP